MADAPLGTQKQRAVEANANVEGCDLHFDSDGDNTAQTIKGSSGVLHGLEVQNPNSDDAWLQLFDNAAPTVGTTTPDQSYLVPAGTSGGLDGAMDRLFIPPLKFGTAITYACTTTPTGMGDPTTGLVVNAWYK